MVNGIYKKDKSFNKVVIIVLEAAVLLTIVVLTVAVLTGNSPLKEEEVTIYVPPTITAYSTVYNLPNGGSDYSSVNNSSVNNPNNAYNNAANDFSASNQVNDNTGSVPVTGNNSVATLSDPSGWTTAQIISKAKDAVNKTKAYTGGLSVNHSESFNADVTECTGGEVVKSVVNMMVGMVVEPVNETLSYQNGQAVNSEGETVPIILPKRGSFSLNEGGVKSASAQLSGNEYVIKITLVSESVGMYDVPTHNAASVGYLDVASFDLSFMEIDSADIVYKGTSFELRINADGYVTYANYKIPLHINGSAHKGSISGSATFEGEQIEEWRLNW